MTLRRGFKSEAEELSIELRAELALLEHDPIDVFLLAEHLAIPTVPLSELAPLVSKNAIRYFSDIEPEVFSGTTIHDEYRRLVLYNDSHTEVRQRSTIAHELSHALLGHPADKLANIDGKRNRNPIIEAEASWLSGVILIPKGAAMRIIFAGLSVKDAAKQYMVSEQMMTYRLRVSGAITIARRHQERAR
jgi:Zn-dependent peptidase ImmA (M78 family)